VSPTVFVSYRREDSAGHAGRLYDALVARFGERSVFMDVELAPGIDFVDRITEAVGACDVLVVVIGPRWAAAPSRLDDPGDYVRLEVETALRRPDVRVVPALVAGARMPAPEDLPDSLRALTRRNAVELSDARWRYDTGRLADAVAGTSSAPAPRRRWVSLAGAGLLAVAAIAAVLIAVQPGGGGGGGGGSGSTGFTTDDAVRIVGTYAQRYRAKDLAGLRRLLSPDVVLARGTRAPVRGADAVMASYRKELDGVRDPSFEWEDSLTDADEEALQVVGRYDRGAGGVVRQTGRFGVRLRGTGSSLLISELCFGCPDLDRPHQLLAQ
jgi:ketosteroid isomerase-like protein